MHLKEVAYWIWSQHAFGFRMWFFFFVIVLHCCCVVFVLFLRQDLAQKMLLWNPLIFQSPFLSC